MADSKKKKSVHIEDMKKPVDKATEDRLFQETERRMQAMEKARAAARAGIEPPRKSRSRQSQDER